MTKMTQTEFEQIIGRRIPGAVYDEIEALYMSSEKNKQDFAQEWSAETVDALICEKFFRVQMMALNFEAKENAYQTEIKKMQHEVQKSHEACRRHWEENNKLLDENEKQAQEIIKLKAALYDKKIL
jgi:hypothetical protein